MFYKNQIEKIMSEAGFSDSDRALFGRVVEIYVFNTPVRDKNSS